MARVIVPEAEAILDREFPVLDHGFLRLADYLGGDSRIVAAAGCPMVPAQRASGRTRR
jgi:thymidylate synthase (FAD)